jgi:hypothetical protein
MDPNVKLFIEELVKQMCDEVREEIHEDFSAHDIIINMCLDEFETGERHREQRVAALKSAASCLSEWKPEVNASLTSVKLELSKLNSFFDQEVKSFATPKSGVLQIDARIVQPSTGVNSDGPAGHRVDTSHRDCGFGRVNTHSHDPVKGMIIPSPPPLLDSLASAP